MSEETLVFSMAGSERSPLRPPDPPLATKSVLLRPLRPADAEAVFQACQDPLIARWTTIPQPYRMEHAVGFISDTIAAWQSGREPTFAILDQASGELGGCVGLRGIGHAVEIGSWMAPQGQGRGLTSDAVRLVSGWTMESFDVERIGLLVYVGNEASARVAEKAGYRREGILRRYAVQRGVARDCIVFSLVREDLAVE
ncbi:GNAT family N-acetyltransferase [soil metagenome]